MKENNNLEEQFKKSLNDLQVGPPDGAKGDIEKRLIDAGLLKEKSEGRGGLWMFVLLALLVAAPLVLLVKRNHKQSKQLAEQKMLKDSGNISDKNSENKTIIYKEDGQDLAEVNKKGKGIDKKDTGSNVNFATGNTAGVGEKKKSKIRSSKTEGPYGIEITESTSRTRKAIRQERRRRENEAKALYAEKIKTEKENASANISISAETLKEAGKKNDGNKIDSTNNGNGLAQVIEPTAVSIGNNLTGAGTSSETKQKADSVVKDTLAMLKSKPKADTTNKQLPQKEKSKGHIAFDFSGAPQFNSFKYGSGAITDNQTYVEQSRQSEKATPSFSAAFGIVLTLNHFIVETGLRHSLLSSDFSYSETYYRIDTTQSHIDTLGQWIHIADTVTGQTHYLATNKISFLEFPVLIGYGFHAAKFEIEIKSGVLVGYITSANTTIFSLNTGSVVKYNELANSPYSKINWSALIAANLLYPLGDRFSVFAQPSMKYGLNSIFKDNYSVTKKIQSLTIGIGLRVKL